MDQNIYATDNPEGDIYETELDSLALMSRYSGNLMTIITNHLLLFIVLKSISIFLPEMKAKP